jgi:hypothetical protein
MIYNKEIKLNLSGSRRYYYFFDADHPLSNKTGRILYHRHVASLKIGRWLTCDEHTHHIDGNSLNNDPDNITVLSRSEHSRIHNPKQLCAINCILCGKLFTPLKSKTKFCGTKCRIESYKKLYIPKEELASLVWEMPSSRVAELLGVCDSAIVKLCRKLEVKKPPRGYWAKVYASENALMSNIGVTSC